MKELRVFDEICNQKMKKKLAKNCQWSVSKMAKDNSDKSAWWDIWINPLVFDVFDMSESRKMKKIIWILE